MIAFRDRWRATLGLELIVHINREGRGARHQSVRLRLVAAHPGDEDRGAEAGARQIRLRRRLRRRAPRRGEEPRQGAHLLVPQHRPCLGSAQPAARALAPLQHPHRPGRDRSASSRCPTGPRLDIWQYIVAENIPIVPLYFAKTRPVVRRDGAADHASTTSACRCCPAKCPQMLMVRFRTLGCYPLTGAIESEAADARRHRRRDADVAHVRAPGPADRQRRDGLDGEEEEGGLFLMPMPLDARIINSSPLPDRARKACCAF